MNKNTFFYALNHKGAGLCSEINNILYAIYFFEQNEFPFKLISNSWISSYDKGWSDYFESLKLEQVSRSSYFKQTKYILIFLNYLENNKRYLRKTPLLSRFHNLFQKLLFKYISKNCYTRYNENFSEMRRFCADQREINTETFYLSINKILNTIWILKPEIKNDIQESIRKKIPENIKYIAIHIRRGDKITSKEDKKYEVNEYIDQVLKLNSKINVIFLMSDDYNSYIELKKKFPKFEIITFLNDTKSGFDERHFKSLSKNNIKSETIQFLTEIEIAKKSTYFIGSFKSNVFRLVQYFKLDNCIDISRTKKPL